MPKPLNKTELENIVLVLKDELSVSKGKPIPVSGIVVRRIISYLEELTKDPAYA
jgi:hypothetical protein